MHDSPLVEKTLSTGADDAGMTRMSEAIMESKGNWFSTDTKLAFGSTYFGFPARNGQFAEPDKRK